MHIYILLAAVCLAAPVPLTETDTKNLLFDAVLVAGALAFTVPAFRQKYNVILREARLKAASQASIAAEASEAAIAAEAAAAQALKIETLSTEALAPQIAMSESLPSGKIIIHKPTPKYLQSIVKPPLTRSQSNSVPDELAPVPFKKVSSMPQQLDSGLVTEPIRRKFAISPTEKNQMREKWTKSKTNGRSYFKVESMVDLHGWKSAKPNSPSFVMKETNGMHSLVPFSSTQ